MDSLTLPSVETLSTIPLLPGWAVPRTPIKSDLDVAFAAGISLKSLDDFVRAAPAFAGCWRARQALQCAAVAVRLMGRAEHPAALRDAVLLTAPGDNPGPVGRTFLAFRKLTTRRGAITTPFLKELADLLDLAFDDQLAYTRDRLDEALHSSRAVPFAAADLIAAIRSTRPDAEILAWALADWLIAKKLAWDFAVPLLISQRYGSAFRSPNGRGRLLPGEAGFERAVCLALVESIQGALRTASDIARRADQLAAVAPKLRTKGKETILQKLLEEDAIAASAPGAGLSRFASARLFERLQGFGAVRELSGRTTFRIYGL